jgi:hypothetical protein
LSNEEKTNDYENFEKGMIYMEILKKGGRRKRNNNNYNFKHLDIREQFIWLMSNEDNFIINQLSDMILKLHSSRNDIIQNTF